MPARVRVYSRAYLHTPRLIPSLPPSRPTDRRPLAELLGLGASGVNVGLVAGSSTNLLPSASPGPNGGGNEQNTSAATATLPATVGGALAASLVVLAAGFFLVRAVRKRRNVWVLLRNRLKINLPVGKATPYAGVAPRIDEEEVDEEDEEEGGDEEGAGATVETSLTPRGEPPDDSRRNSGNGEGVDVDVGSMLSRRVVLRDSVESTEGAVSISVDHGRGGGLHDHDDAASSAAVGSGSVASDRGLRPTLIGGLTGSSSRRTLGGPANLTPRTDDSSSASSFVGGGGSNFNLESSGAGAAVMAVGGSSRTLPAAPADTGRVIRLSNAAQSRRVAPVPMQGHAPVPVDAASAPHTPRMPPPPQISAGGPAATAAAAAATLAAATGVVVAPSGPSGGLRVPAGGSAAAAVPHHVPRPPSGVRGKSAAAVEVPLTPPESPPRAAEEDGDSGEGEGGGGGTRRSSSAASSSGIMSGAHTPRSSASSVGNSGSGSNSGNVSPASGSAESADDGSTARDDSLRHLQRLMADGPMLPGVPSSDLTDVESNTWSAHVPATPPPALATPPALPTLTSRPARRDEVPTAGASAATAAARRDDTMLLRNFSSSRRAP